METKANYVTVGIFTLVTVLLGFAFVYWVARLDERGANVEMEIMIEGSVTGLTKGSPVLFNGINVGKVRKLTIATNAPRFVLAVVEINADTPIRKDTKASIGIQGFTGGAYIQLEGGTNAAGNILNLADQPEGQIPRINADPAALSDIIARVNEIAARTEKVMGGIESFLDENRESLSKTVANAEKFSDALAANSDGVEKFLASVSDIGKTIGDLSAKLDGTIARAEEIVKAVEPGSIRTSITNLEEFSKTLKSSRDDINKVVASIKGAAGKFNTFSENINKTLDKVDRLVASVDSAKVGSAIDDISAVAKNVKGIVSTFDGDNFNRSLADIGKVAADAKKVIAAVEPPKVKKMVADLGRTVDKASKVVDAIDPPKVRKLVTDLGGAVDKISGVVSAIDPPKVEKIVADVSKAADKAAAVVEAVDPPKVRKLIADLGKTIDKASKVVEGVDTAKVSSAIDDVKAAAAGAKTIVADISAVTDKVKNRGDDVNQIITDAKELSAKLNKASDKVDGILTKVDGLLGSGDSKGLVEEARKTLAEFRKLAVNLDKRVREISVGLNRFSNRGLRDAEVLIRDARRSINRIDHVISNFENNPSGFISGSGGVRQVRGSRPRR